MALLRQVGRKRDPAQPRGAPNQCHLDIRTATERYRDPLELGDQMEVVPEVEIWCPAKCLSQLSEAAYVACASGHPKACILPDVYHLYKGGSPFQGLRLLSAHAVHVIHFNDYPA